MESKQKFVQKMSKAAVSWARAHSAIGDRISVINLSEAYKAGAAEAFERLGKKDEKE